MRSPLKPTFSDLGVNVTDLAVGYHAGVDDVGMFSELWPEDEDLDTPEFRSADARASALALQLLRG